MSCGVQGNDKSGYSILPGCGSEDDSGIGPVNAGRLIVAAILS